MILSAFPGHSWNNASYNKESKEARNMLCIHHIIKIGTFRFGLCLSCGLLTQSFPRRQVPGRSSPLRRWGHTGCESEAAFADSVSHTSFPYCLALLRRLRRRRGAIELQQGFCAGLPVQMPQLTAYLLPTRSTGVVGRSDCWTTEALH